MGLTSRALRGLVRERRGERKRERDQEEGGGGGRLGLRLLGVGMG